MFWRHAHPLTAPLLTQFTEFGESNRAIYAGGLKWLDREIAGRDYIAGDAYTMADICALTTVDFAAFTGLEMPEECAALRGWHGRVSARASAAA
jgi:glutathione S-transferase